MRIPRLYLDQTLTVGQTVCLDEGQSHYLLRVLRMEPGRQLKVFDGLGQEAEATLLDAAKKSAQLRIEQAATVDRESPLRTHLAIGISRGERMDWVLQKATELGVTEITPLFTERTEVRIRGERLNKKQTHWQKVIISACEQCQRNCLPRLHAPTSLHDFLPEALPGLRLVLHHRNARNLTQHPKPHSLTLLIGPEGGLTSDEIAHATQDFGFEAITLGPRILRTETAPVASLTAVQLLWGDLG